MKKIAIMPGHGGPDPGAINRTYNQMERDFNWKEATELYDKLTAAGHQVLICREENIDERLSVMQQKANDFGADICFCLHHNAYNGYVSGWGVYYATGQSKELAEKVREAYRADVSLNPHGNGLKHATPAQNRNAYNCISKCNMPTVLLESCFIDNDKDCEWLMRGGWLEVVNTLFSITHDGAVPEEKITPHGLCEIYVEAHREGEVELPGLMGISFAQWILESGWCRSELARNAFNFGGLQDRPEVERGGAYEYKGIEYEKFDSPEEFIKGYWEFLDRAPYKSFNTDKARYANDPIGFIQTIGPTYCPAQNYVESIISLYNSERFLPYRMHLEDAVRRTLITYMIVSDDNDRLKQPAKIACNFWNRFIIPNSSIVIRLGTFTSYGRVIARAYRPYSSADVTYGRVEFNTKYLNQYTKYEIAGTVIHEIGHTLGFGWDKWMNLFHHDDGSFKSRYINEISDLQYMFVETDYGPGTQFSHWDEYRFDEELMTGIKDRFEYVLPVTINVMKLLGHRVAEPLSELTDLKTLMQEVEHLTFPRSADIQILNLEHFEETDVWEEVYA